MGTESESQHAGAKWCFNLGNNERSANKKARIRDQKALAAASAKNKKEDGPQKTVVTYDPSGYDRSAVREKVLTTVQPQKETDAIKARAMAVAQAPGKSIPQAAFMLCELGRRGWGGLSFERDVNDRPPTNAAPLLPTQGCPGLRSTSSR